MKQRTRILIGVGILVLIVLLLVGGEALRRSTAVLPAHAAKQGTPAVTLDPGSIPIYLNSQFVAGFSPKDLSQLKKASFVESAEGVTQDGWLLRDVLLLYFQPDQLQAGMKITVSSSSRKKSAELTWAEISDEKNMVMFDLANRGTLKLVSKMERLNTREEWVQDVDKIEVGH